MPIFAMILLFTLLGKCAAAAPLQCQSQAVMPTWPIYHIFNNVTRNAAGELVMRHLNDANAIFEYKGLYHSMCQAGGGVWTHAISNDLIHWVSGAPSKCNSRPRPTRFLAC